MSERRLQSKFVPVQLRFRTASRQGQEEREQEAPKDGTRIAQDDLVIADGVAAQKRARQIKELLRLGKLLRADLVLEEEHRTLREAHDPVEKVTKLMRPEFRISESYFISHERADLREVGTLVI